MLHLHLSLVCHKYLRILSQNIYGNNNKIIVNEFCDVIFLKFHILCQNI